MDRRQFVIGLTGTVALAGSAKFANAQGGNTTRIIFPYAAGGSGDATIRLIADKMQASLNQPVVVENRTDGAGRIGVSAVKNAPPDGLTLLYTPFAAVTIYPFVYKTLEYDPVSYTHLTLPTKA